MLLARTESDRWVIIIQISLNIGINRGKHVDGKN
jgi:hypothetical protein